MASSGSHSSDINGTASTATERHTIIVDYLKRVNTSRTMDDVFEDLNIDLSEDTSVLDMLKDNPKVEVHETEDDVILQYARHFELRNMAELKEAVKRVKTGIAFLDIEMCYPDIMDDCKEMIVGGEDVIAIKNTDKKTFVMYPRGKPFYTRLSGTITAKPNQFYVQTSESLLDEIRRGDAVSVGGSWFRVSSAVGNGTEKEQTQRSTAPLSVTSDKEMSDKNIYYLSYNKEKLPLDSAFDKTAAVTERGKRHGCSNDIRKLWRDSLNLQGWDEDVENELLQLKLITKKAKIETAPAFKDPATIKPKRKFRGWMKK